MGFPTYNSEAPADVTLNPRSLRYNSSQGAAECRNRKGPSPEVKLSWSSCCRHDPGYPAWKGTPYIPSHLDTLMPPPGSLKQKIHENSTLGSMCLSCFLYKNNKFSSNSCSRKTCYAPPLVLLNKCHGHRALEQKMLRTEESSRARQAGRLPQQGVKRAVHLAQ